MTAASTIMVCPIAPLNIPDADRDVIRRWLLEGIQGIDDEHNRRWQRYIKGLLTSAPGEVTEFLNPRRRSLPFHRRWMAIEKRVYENQETFATRKGFRRWLKAGAGLGEYERQGDRLVFVPASTGFESLSDDDMREFVRAAEEFLHTPLAQRRLWPHVTAAARQEMLELVLANPKETQT